MRTRRLTSTHRTKLESPLTLHPTVITDHHWIGRIDRNHEDEEDEKH